ncbi:hypothetical protein [Brucella sp. IR073]|uniref:hypothetical protein n=1 Tax=unclassified Brucella TaxID=2632610 RepID=UPI003B9834D1
MEARVTALEAKFDKIDGKLDRLIDEMSSFRLDMVRFDGRVSALEATLDARASALDAKLDARSSALDARISAVDSKIGALPSAEAFGHLRGRVESLPTVSTFASMFVIAVAAGTILNNWQTVLAFFK